MVGQIIPKLVSYLENGDLIQVTSLEQLQLTMFSMDSNSLLGPDGFSGLFFQKAWSVVGDEVSFFILPIDVVWYCDNNYGGYVDI